MGVINYPYIPNLTSIVTVTTILPISYFYSEECYQVLSRTRAPSKEGFQDVQWDVWMQKQDKNWTDSISMEVRSGMFSVLLYKKFVDTKGAESLDFYETILIQICESIGLLKNYIMISLCKYAL